MDLTVRHALGEYPIRFCSLTQVKQAIRSDDFLITDENVAAAWPDIAQACPRLIVPPGETSKSMTQYSAALDWLAEMGCRRNQRLIAFGGGVVGDLGGFVAATYMRGIELIQVPTSLLAMVDSSVGGKVAIDHPRGKNLVGSFYAPSQVLVCEEFLTTLPNRHRVNGLAEILKAGFIAEPALLTRPDIFRAIEVKKGIVEADERERRGIRATLNFGHTVGHALETYLDYEQLLHGEAISIGMVVETHLGHSLGVTPSDLILLVTQTLDEHGLPTKVRDFDLKKCVEIMKQDKKATSERLSFSLLTGLGTCKLVNNVNEDQVLNALNAAR